MNSMRDDISRMTPKKAEQTREEYTLQLKFQRERLVKLKARRDRLMKKLNEEIEKVEADIHNITSVIYEIDAAHFNTLDPEPDERVYDECF